MKKEKQKCQQGISLVALIVTIIVIIILSAISIGGSFNTPDKARYAKFCNDLDNVEQSVGVGFLNEKKKQYLSSKKLENAEIYTYVACGNTTSSNTKTVNGETVVLIENNPTSRLEMELPDYGDRKWYVGTETGSVYLIPGFEYENLQYFSKQDIRDGGKPIISEDEENEGLEFVINVGNYVKYEPNVVTYLGQTTDTTVLWRVLKIEGNNVYLTTEKPVNKLSLSGPDGAVNGVSRMELLCKKLYSKGSITARSMTVEDVNELCGFSVPEPTQKAYYLADNVPTETEVEWNNNTYKVAPAVLSSYLEAGFTDNRFYLADGGGEIRTDENGVKYYTPIKNTPVYETSAHYEYAPLGLNEEIANILGDDKCWVASTGRAVLHNYVVMRMFYASKSKVKSQSLQNSSGYNFGTFEYGIRPIVAISKSSIKVDATKDGTQAKPFELK